MQQSGYLNGYCFLQRILQKKCHGINCSLCRDNCIYICIYMCLVTLRYKIAHQGAESKYFFSARAFSMESRTSSLSASTVW